MKTKVNHSWARARRKNNPTPSPLPFPCWKWSEILREDNTFRNKGDSLTWRSNESLTTLDKKSAANPEWSYLPSNPSSVPSPCLKLDRLKKAMPPWTSSKKSLCCYMRNCLNLRQTSSYSPTSPYETKLPQSQVQTSLSHEFVIKTKLPQS